MPGRSSIGPESRSGPDGRLCESGEWGRKVDGCQLTVDRKTISGNLRNPWTEKGPRERMVDSCQLTVDRKNNQSNQWTAKGPRRMKSDPKNDL